MLPVPSGAMTSMDDGLRDLANIANGPNHASTDDLYLSSFRALGSDDLFEASDRLSQRDAQAVQYVKSQLTEGDTLVFVKFPGGRTAYNITGFELRDRHVVHSEKLLESGSKYFIDVLQSREQQFRLQRRHGLVGRLPEGIKYLLDLTPPEEGDEALILTASLSCPLGVRKWYISERLCGVSASLVGGSDEVTLQDLAYVADNLDRKPADSPQDPLEYCPIRHRTGIERLLQVIEGKDPRLDSAPKVWTLVTLAKYFECAKVVEDYVLSWLLAEPNTRFIEILPEAALNIGIMIENEYITKFAFSILVSEKALQLGAGNFYRDFKLTSSITFDSQNNKKTTRFGRPIEDIVDEDWTNIIQYAAQTFSSRIHSQVTNLLHEDVLWIKALPEYRKILDFEQFLQDGVEISSPMMCRVNFIKHIDNLHLGIRDFVRGRLFRCILTSLVSHVADRLQANRVADNLHVHPEHHFFEIYNSLNDQAKVFTRPFWEMVQYLNWSMEPKDNEIFDKVRTGSMEDYRNIIIGESYKVRYVTTDQIMLVAKSLNLAIFTATRQMGYNGGNLPMEASGTFLPKLAFPRSVEHTSGASEEIDTSMTEVDIKSAFATLTTYDEVEAAPRNHMDRLSTAAINEHSGIPTMSHSSKEHDEVKIKLFGEETEVSREEVGYDFSINHSMFPLDEIISPRSTFFSLTRLFSQIDDYLHAICAECLHKGPFTVSSICDTLLSLSDKEYAFLPLWAGGMNDGSGGVFADEIPPAQRGGPSEPGPAYHTGSTVNSTASSECDFDGERYSFLSESGSKSGDTSMDVENGEQTHGGRGSVLSEDEFPISEGYSEVAFREEEVVSATEVPRAGIVVPIPSSYIEDENFFDAPDEESEEELDWDVLSEEDDGDETETEN